MARTNLIVNCDEMKAALSSITADLKYETLSSFLEDADTFFAGPAIGAPVYLALMGDSLDPAHAALLRILQRSVMNHAIWNYAASGSVMLSESGITVVKDNRLLPASDKKILQLRRQCRRDAFAQLEAAVNYLEDPDNSAYFPEYLSSYTHQRNRRFYCNSTEEFSSGFDLQGNAIVFSQLKAVMQTIEENYIDRLLGDDFAAQLRAAVLTGKPSPIQQQLLARIIRAVAPLTIAEAIPYRLVDLDESGLVTETTKGNAENVEVSLEGSFQSLQEFMNRCQMRGESEVAKLTSWLNNNRAQFPTYQVRDTEAMSKLNDDSLRTYFL